MNELILNSNTTDSTCYREQKSEWAVPYPDIAQWVRIARASWGRESKLGQWLV
jgi:hypothetical protein